MVEAVEVGVIELLASRCWKGPGAKKCWQLLGPEKGRERALPRASGRNAARQHLDVSPVKTISDF